VHLNCFPGYILSTYYTLNVDVEFKGKTWRVGVLETKGGIQGAHLLGTIL